MLTPNHLAAIKAYAMQCLPHDIVSYKHYDALIVELERLTRHNQRMSAALAQLSDKELWGEYSIDYGGFTIEKSMWNGAVDPQQLAERALVEDSE